MSDNWVDFYVLTELQIKIMHFIDDWARKEKTPIPHSEVIKGINKQGGKESGTVYAIRALIKKGYIRKAIITSNKTYYVQLRRV